MIKHCRFLVSSGHRLLTTCFLTLSKYWVYYTEFWDKIDFHESEMDYGFVCLGSDDLQILLLLTSNFILNMYFLTSMHKRLLIL